jgi:hypothetical protein
MRRAFHCLHLAGIAEEAEIQAAERLLGTGAAPGRRAVRLIHTRSRPGPVDVGRPVVAARPASGIDAAAARGPRLERAVRRKPVGIEQRIEAPPFLAGGAQQAAQTPAQALEVQDAARSGDRQRVDLLAQSEGKAVVAQQVRESE